MAKQTLKARRSLKKGSLRRKTPAPKAEKPDWHGTIGRDLLECHSRWNGAPGAPEYIDFIKHVGAWPGFPADRQPAPYLEREMEWEDLETFDLATKRLQSIYSCVMPLPSGNGWMVGERHPWLKDEMGAKAAGRSHSLLSRIKAWWRR